MALVKASRTALCCGVSSLRCIPSMANGRGKSRTNGVCSHRQGFWVWFERCFLLQKQQEFHRPLAKLSSGDPPGARTQDPNIKSVVLYLLS